MENNCNLGLLCHAAELEKESFFFPKASFTRELNCNKRSEVKPSLIQNIPSFFKEDLRILGKRSFEIESSSNLPSQPKKRSLTWSSDNIQVKAIQTNQEHATEKNKLYFKKDKDQQKTTSGDFQSIESLLSTEDTIEKPKLSFYTPIITMNWLTHLEELKEFKRQYGHCNVSRKNTQWKSLGHWVRQQRRKKKNGKLNETQILFLEKMDFEWDRSYYLYSKVPHKEALRELQEKQKTREPSTRMKETRSLKKLETIVEKDGKKGNIRNSKEQFNCLHSPITTRTIGIFRT